MPLSNTEDEWGRIAVNGYEKINRLLSYFD